MGLFRSVIQNMRSFLGLYSLVAGGMAVLALVLSFLVFVFLPELRPVVRILVALALILLLLFVVGAYSQVRSTVLARQTRYGTNTGLMIVAFLGIALLVNLISVENHRRIDVTASGQYTLSGQTIRVLKDLKDAIKVVGFFNDTPDSQVAQSQADSLLTEYRFQSSKISFEFVDPDRKPGVANQYEVRQVPALVFASGTRNQQTFDFTEQAITAAILKVTGTKQPKVYFLVGHGEHDINANDETGYNLAKEGIKADNYEVLPLNLSSASEMPSDAALLVVAGPKRPFLPHEVKLLEQYLEADGQALFMVDPNPLPEIKDLLAKWGVKLMDGTVVDEALYMTPDKTTPAVQGSQYVFPDITTNVAASFYPGAAGMVPDIPEADKDHVLVLPLALSTAFSYLETDPANLRFDVGTDPRGPLPLAVIVAADKPIGQRPQRTQTDAEAISPENPKFTRLVVFADSDFATNNYFYSEGNSDLFLNSVNWLTAQYELISIRPKPPAYRRLVITQRDWNFILYSTIAFWPLAVLLAGGVAWWRRR